MRRRQCAYNLDKLPAEAQLFSEMGGLASFSASPLTDSIKKKKTNVMGDGILAMGPNEKREEFGEI